MYLIGTDILKVDRIKDIINENPSVQKRIFTNNEIEEASSRKVREIYYYATRFAAKEAVYKSLNVPLDSKSDLYEIEILNEENGRPYVILHGNIKEISKISGIISIDISISYEEEYVIATAIATGAK